MAHVCLLDGRATQAIHGDDGGSKAFVPVSTLERKTPAVINRGRETIFIQAG
jgi:hypothetical protein